MRKREASESQTHKSRDTERLRDITREREREREK